jgi:hypothetical protein
LKEAKAQLEDVLSSQHDAMTIQQDRTIQALRAEVSSLRSENEAQTRDLHASSDAISTLTAASTELQEKVRQLLNEQGHLREENLSYKLELDRYKNEVDRMCAVTLQATAGSPGSAMGSEGQGQGQLSLGELSPAQQRVQARRHSSYNRSEWEQTYGIEAASEWFGRDGYGGSGGRSLASLVKTDRSLFLTPLETIDHLSHGNVLDGSYDRGNVHGQIHGHEYGQDEKEGMDYGLGSQSHQLLPQTHPYHPHHPYASSMWQAAVTQQQVNCTHCYICMSPSLFLLFCSIYCLSL